ncbi:MAG: prolyl oligopeptidase family serine peptidase [Verrucomicrobia bacterium]|nr:prolyl oligopeptidase family serine peptidase [Verrucomicrobiota bacterium]
MTFSDKPEYLILPLNGDPSSVECAAYPPRLSDNGKFAGIVLHLYGSNGSSHVYNMMREPYAKVRRLLWERGYWLLVPNLGPTHWMNDTAANTLDGIIEGMIRDHGVDPARVNILGTSMGGSSALIYTMRHPGRVRAICAVFPATDFEQWALETPRYLKVVADAHGVEPAEEASVLQALSPINHLESFKDIPVLLIHGDDDSTVPPHHSRDFATSLQQHGFPVTYREAQGIGHDDLIAEPFQQEIVDFLTNAAASSDGRK